MVYNIQQNLQVGKWATLRSCVYRKINQQNPNYGKTGLENGVCNIYSQNQTYHNQIILKLVCTNIA